MNENNNQTKPGLKLVDIGANLTNKAFNKDLSDVLERAQLAGVSKLIVTGTTVEESIAAEKLALKHSSMLFSTAGIHPHYAKYIDPESLLALRQLATSTKVKAIGECGLDFNRNFSDQDQQVYAFEQQIELAIDLQLPLFLHERDAFNRQWEMLSNYRNRLSKIVIHCFTGDKNEAFKYLDLDCYIGITGWICDQRRGYHLHEFIGDIPLNRLMIETDSPYLVPKVKPKPRLASSGRNEPNTLPYVLKAIADNSHWDIDAIAENTTVNAFDFFQLE